MEIWICDDNKDDLIILENYLEKFFFKYSNTYSLRQFNNETELIDYYDNNVSPDIIFLDIYLTNSIGIDVAKLLYSKGYKNYIIFTTNSSDFALESYKINADGYLCKPIKYNEFNSLLEKIIKNMSLSLKSISIKSDRMQLNIYLKDITYIESGNHCSYLHAKDKIVKTSKTISQFEAELKDNEEFIKCHQSFIVNLNYVKCLEKYYIKMNDDSEILVSSRDFNFVKKKYANYYWSQT